MAASFPKRRIAAGTERPERWIPFLFNSAKRKARLSDLVIITPRPISSERGLSPPSCDRQLLRDDPASEKSISSARRARSFSATSDLFTLIWAMESRSRMVTVLSSRVS
jgi:hypothetical protein